MYISDNSSKNSNKAQTNLNRIVVASYDNTPQSIKNSEEKSTKDIEPNNIDKIITNSDTKTNVVDSSNQNNNTITESIKTTTITKTVENNENIEKRSY